MTTSEIVRSTDERGLVAAAAERFTGLVRAAIAERGRARVVLTGGGAGIALLEALRDRAVDWPRVEFFWGDERFLPEGHPDRNEVQAQDALLSHVEVDPALVHRMPADGGVFAGDPEAAAEDYATMLSRVDGFDVHLLGMGGEGHVNSIFPHSPAVRETVATVVAVRDCPKPPPTRITLTLPEVRTAREVWLLVAGEAKAEAAARAVADAAPDDVPAAGARGTQRTVWFFDEAAAAAVPRMS